MIFCANPHAQYLSYQDEIDAAIQSVLNSGSYILGTEVEQFEKEFAAYNSVTNAVGVGSGTEALHMSLRALEIGPGDEVITTAHTAVATATAIILSGAKPVFVDIEQDYFTIDPSLIEENITPKTKAIIPVHIYGQACDMDSILEIAQRNNLKVIEDCAQAHGATYKGKRVGSMGDIGCFSFYPTKNLGAIGDGGSLVMNDDHLGEKIRLLREYGWQDRYISSSEGWNSRLDELQSAILRVKLTKLDADNASRKKLACKYDNDLKDLPLEIPKVSNDASHVYHLYVVMTSNRDVLKAYLQEQGIHTMIQYPIPIHQQKYFQNIIGDISLPVTEQVATAILSLPMYPEIIEEEHQAVVNEVKNYYEGLS